MIKWLDLISPRLKAIHQDWVQLREAQFMPHINSYNRFAMSAAATAEADKSVCVVAPADGKPVLKHVGGAVTRLMPGCRGGLRLADAFSIGDRNPLTLHLPRVLTGRQPESRRSSQRINRETREIEILFLPFGDDRLRVCVVHTIFDLGVIDWKQVFA